MKIGEPEVSGEKFFAVDKKLLRKAFFQAKLLANLLESFFGSAPGFSDINHGRVPGGEVEEGKDQNHDPDDHRNRLQDSAEDIPGEGIGAQMTSLTALQNYPYSMEK